MGNYRGGSTIITRGQFGSYDPAEGIGRSSPPKRKSTPSLKKTKNHFLKDKQVLHNIIDQMLSHTDPITVPGKVSPSLKVKIDRTGGPLIWAEQHPGFKSLKAKKVKKKHDRQLLRMANKTLVSEAKAPLHEKNQVTLPSTEAKKTENVKTNQITTEDRNSLMGSLIHQKLSGAKSLKIPIGNAPVLNEARAADTPQQWLEAQIGYIEIFNQFSKFKKTYVAKKKIQKHASQDPVIPREVSSRLTSQNINLRGLERTNVHSTYEVNIDLLLSLVGILPPTPMLLNANHHAKGKKKKKLQKSWLGLMDKDQKNAWNGLNENQRRMYFTTGKIKIGFPPKTKIKSIPSDNNDQEQIRRRTVKTLETKKATKKRSINQSKPKRKVQTVSDGPIDHVLEKLDAPQEELWYKKEDWNIT